ncbi:hypothetical protein ACFL6U_28000 [Planctomycetota bacterium]
MFKEMALFASKSPGMQVVLIQLARILVNNGKKKARCRVGGTEPSSLSFCAPFIGYPAEQLSLCKKKPLRRMIAGSNHMGNHAGGCIVGIGRWSRLLNLQ